MEVDALVTAAASGDPDAFAALVRRYAGTVGAIALATVRDRAAAEDVVQEVFVALWRGLPGLRSPQSLLPWLRQTTRNRARARLRSLRRRRRVVAPAPRAAEEDRRPEDAPDPAPSPEARLEAAQEREAVRDALEALPDDAREVVLLYYREGRSTAQVAALLELREATVRKRLSRARTRLKAALLGRLDAVARETAPGEETAHAVLAALLAPTAGGVGVGGVGAAGGAAAGGAGLAGGAAGLASLGAAGAVGAGAGFLAKVRLRGGDVPPERRRDLRILRLAGLALVAGTAAAFPAVLASSRGIWAPVSLLGAFSAGLLALFFVWLPRATGRRPTRGAWILFGVGLTAAWLALAFVLARLGRI